MLRSRSKALSILVTLLLLTVAACSSDQPLAADRQWQTLLATSIEDPLWTPQPVPGPDGTPVAVSAFDDTARIWTYEDDDWGVSQSVTLVGQFVAESDHELPASMAPTATVVIDSIWTSRPRFLLPTSYANGPAVAAIGYRDGEWKLLPFMGVNGGPHFVADAELVDGQVVVWYNSCLFSCADTESIPLGVEPTDIDYQVHSPPPPPTLPLHPLAGDLCLPGSSPDCTDRTVDGLWRLIEGWEERLTHLDQGLCTDLDGDGRAGYPESG